MAPVSFLAQAQAQAPAQARPRRRRSRTRPSPHPRLSHSAAANCPSGEDEKLTTVQEVRRALVRLPLAALGAALALRPRRRGTPPRQIAVVETQIILAAVGALIMLIVGASLARAFGIVGAANLIRYRSKIEDPKDAVVMLCALRWVSRLASASTCWPIAHALPGRPAVGDRVVRAGGYKLFELKVRAEKKPRRCAEGSKRCCRIQTAVRGPDTQRRTNSRQRPGAPRRADRPDLADHRQCSPKDDKGSSGPKRNPRAKYQ